VHLAHSCVVKVRAIQTKKLEKTTPEKLKSGKLSACGGFQSCRFVLPYSFLSETYGLVVRLNVVSRKQPEFSTKHIRRKVCRSISGISAGSIWFKISPLQPSASVVLLISKDYPSFRFPFLDSTSPSHHPVSSYNHARQPDQQTNVTTQWCQSRRLSFLMISKRIFKPQGMCGLFSQDSLWHRLLDVLDFRYQQKLSGFLHFNAPCERNETQEYSSKKVDAVSLFQTDLVAIERVKVVLGDVS
jgi:hypothetical protein